MISPWEVDTGPLETTLPLFEQKTEMEPSEMVPSLKEEFDASIQPDSYNPTPEEYAEIEQNYQAQAPDYDNETTSDEEDPYEYDSRENLPSITITPKIPETQALNSIPIEWLPSIFDLKASLTDSWTANIFTAFYKGKIFYRRENTGIQGWVSWGGTHWLIGEGHLVVDLFRTFVENYIAPLKKIFIDKAKEVEKDKNFAYEVSKTVTAYLKYLRSTRGIEQTLRLASMNPSVNVSFESFDSNPKLLNLKNGTLDFSSMTLRPHSPSDMITKYIPIEYNPNAECPAWMRFIRETTCDDDGLADYLQRMTGYALTGDTSEQLLFILKGYGRNGKSLFINTIRDMLAGYAAQGTLDMLTSIQKPDGDRANPALAGLKGRYLVTLSETRRESKLQEHLVKQITGEDKIRARSLYQDFFEFQPRFKIFLSSNHNPIIHDMGLGMWRRIRIIPFNNTVSEENEDPTLYSKFMAEAPGIMAWMIRGELKRKIRPLKHDTPTTIRDAIMVYKGEMDIVGHFLEEETIQDKNEEIPVNTLYSRYKLYCENSNERALTKRNLSQELKDRGYVQDRNKDHTARVWKGLKLNL